MGRTMFLNNVIAKDMGMGYIVREEGVGGKGTWTMLWVSRVLQMITLGLCCGAVQRKLRKIIINF